MQIIIGILLILLLLALIVWAFQNFLGILGILLVVWGIYEWNKNKKLGAKSKKPGTIVIVGIILTIGWFGSSGDPIPTETATTTSSKEVSTEVKENQPAQKQAAAPEKVNQANNQQKAKQNTLIAAKVLSVTDGDTMKVLVNGKEEAIRLLLIDTPETKHPNKPVQPYGTEASSFTKSSLEGKDIQLELDASQRDKYGRLLAYIWLGDKMFNQTLLEKGLARVSVYPPNVKYVDQYRETQKKAQQAGIAIWSIENYVKDDGYHTEVKATQKPATPQQPRKIEEKPKSEPAEQLPTFEKSPTPSASSNVYYKNCSEARAAGAAPLYEGDPGYSSKLDKDKDGVACE